MTLASPNSGLNGGSSLGITAADNNSTSARTGTITISNSNDSTAPTQTINVIQAGVCSYTISPTASSFLAQGTSGSLQVTTTDPSCAWSPTSDSSWLTINSSSPTQGTGTLGFTLASNTTAGTRKATVTIGGNPVTITQSGANQQAIALVTNSVGNSVSVLQLDQNAVVATIPVGTDPRGVVLSPDGRRAYVVNAGSGTVSVVDPFAQSVVSTITVGSQPTEAAIAPDGTRLYVTNYGSSTVSVIDPSNNAILASIPVAANPEGIAVSPDGSTVYVASSGAGVVNVVSPATGQVTGTIAVGNTPFGLALSPDGKTGYVSNYGDGTVSVLDLTKNAVTATLTVGTHPTGIAVLPSGARVYVANDGSNSISVIDTTTDTVLATPITAGNNPRGLAVTADGLRLIVGNYQASTASIVDTSNNTVVASPAVGTQPRPGVAAGACTVLVTASANIPAGGGSGSFAVDSYCPYTAVSNAGFITVTGTSTPTGNGNVFFTVAANSLPSARTGTVTVNGQTFTLTQAAFVAGLTFSPTSNTVGAAGGSGAIVVTSNSVTYNWTAASSASWLTITAGASGTGSGTISYNVAANNSTSPRTATITAADQTFTLTQSGVSCSYSLSAPNASYAPTSSTGTVALTTSSPCTWTAAANVSWIHPQPASGTGSATVSFLIDANTGAARSGTLTVGGQSVAISQATGVVNDTTLSTTAAVSLYNTYSAFVLNSGNTTPQTRTLTLSSGLGAAAYTSSVTGAPSFVSVSPASGLTPANVTLVANPAGLAPGTYTNTVNFVAGGGTTAYTVMLTIQPAGANGSKVSIYRDSSGLFLLDSNGDGSCCAGDLVGTIGQAGDIPLTGDWTGTGVKKFGLYRPSTGLFLLDVNNSGTFDAGDKAYQLAAQAGDVPVVGDWTGTGVDRIGVFRASTGTWYLDKNNDGSFVGRAYLGQAGDIPVVGNWSGVGTSTNVGIYRPTSMNGQPGNFFLVDGNGDGQYTAADPPVFFFGQPGDIPMVGDWNGDGKSKVGLLRPAGSAGGGAGLMILDQNGNFAWDGPGTDRVLFFGPYLNGLTNSTTIQAGDIPITGNWTAGYGASNTLNLQGRTRTGIFRPGTGTFFLDVSGDGTFQGRAYLGQSGDVPVGVPVMSGGTVIGVNSLGNF